MSPTSMIPCISLQVHRLRNLRKCMSYSIIISFSWKLLRKLKTGNKSLLRIPNFNDNPSNNIFLFFERKSIQILHLFSSFRTFIQVDRNWDRCEKHSVIYSAKKIWYTNDYAYIIFWLHCGLGIGVQSSFIPTCSCALGREIWLLLPFTNFM